MYAREIELQLEDGLWILKDIMPPDKWRQLARDYTTAVVARRPRGSSEPLVFGDDVTSEAFNEASLAERRRTAGRLQSEMQLRLTD
jgi:hypothetical protein